MSRVGVSAKAARTEALRLYRDVLRACRLFDTTRNEQGQLMCTFTPPPKNTLVCAVLTPEGTGRAQE